MCIICSDEVILLTPIVADDTNPDIVLPPIVVCTFKMPEILMLLIPHKSSLKIPKFMAELKTASISTLYAVRVLHYTAYFDVFRPSIWSVMITSSIPSQLSVKLRKS